MVLAEASGKDELPPKNEGQRLLRKALNEAGEAQDKVARRTGIPQQTLSRLARGDNLPSMAVANRLLKAFQIPLLAWVAKPRSK